MVLPQKRKLSYSPQVLWGASEHTLGTVAPRALKFIHSFTNSSAYKYIIQNTNRDFFGGPVVNKSPCKAKGQGFDPDQGTKIPYAAEQLRPRATTAEPVRHSERPGATAETKAAR